MPGWRTRRLRLWMGFWRRIRRSTLSGERTAGSAIVRMEFILAALCVGLAIREPRFLASDNLLTVLRSISMQGIIAFGMTLVIIVGEIDLSVGATVSFAGCLIAWTTQRGLPIPLGGVLTVLMGYGLGAFVGLVRNRYLMPTFITTLA